MNSGGLGHNTRTLCVTVTPFFAVQKLQAQGRSLENNHYGKIWENKNNSKRRKNAFTI